MTEDRSQWRPFIERACEAVGIDPATIEEDPILDMAAKIAREGERPMAPVGTYILGLAIGSGHGDLEELRAKIEATI